MTTETAKRLIVHDILNTWLEHPQLRFGQLIVDIYRKDPYYIDDMDTIKLINKFRKEAKEA